MIVFEAILLVWLFILARTKRQIEVGVETTNLLTARYIFGHFVPAMQIAQKPAEGGPQPFLGRFRSRYRQLGSILPSQ